MGEDFVWIERSVIYALHDQLLAEHGGPPGIRDEDLVESALARPQHQAAYGEPDACALAAAYADAIVRNHPFADGNKRTAFMAAYVFLARNGYQLNASEQEASHAMLALAAGDLDETAFAEWLRRHTNREMPS